MLHIFYASFQPFLIDELNACIYFAFITIDDYHYENCSN